VTEVADIPTGTAEVTEVPDAQVVKLLPTLDISRNWLSAYVQAVEESVTVAEEVEV
jgi:hypothetical protein